MDTGIVIDSEFVLAEAEYLPVEIEDTGTEEVCLEDTGTEEVCLDGYEQWQCTS